MSQVDVAEVAEAMLGLVRECHGLRNLKATDLTKAMLERFGEASCDRQTCKRAIRALVDDGRCVYSYLGGSYIVLPPDAQMDAPVRVVPLSAPAGDRVQGAPGTTVKSSARPRQVEARPPCSDACLARSDVRGALAHLAQRSKTGASWEQACEQAWRSLVETNPFPAVMGRICPHPCEDACTRTAKDGAVAMTAIERYLGDWALERGLGLPAVERATRKERVAVVGAGPAGLSCAAELARRGYLVTVFERRPEPGGMLRYGVPAHRLPRAVLAGEVQRIVDLGVELRRNQAATVSALRPEFAAVLVAIGAHEPRHLEGVSGQGVLLGADVLRRVAQGERPPMGRDIVVVGGGNTAIDAARVCARLSPGAAVTLLRQENDQVSSELAGAIEERVRVEMLATVAEVVRSPSGEVCEVVAHRVTLGERDVAGFPTLVPLPGGEFRLVADTVIVAVGQRPELGLAGLTVPLSVTSGGQTAQPGVWAAGDAVHLGLAAAAVAQGRDAALSIHARLSGEHGVAEVGGDSLAPGRVKLALFDGKERVARTRLPVPVRLASTELEVELGVSAEQAEAEGSRCMSCGRCSGCERCWMFCTPGSVVKLPVRTPGHHYRLALDTCDGCRKCAEECPSGCLEMV
jgi:NADPH-dependent glutamate synthase beta subunit-like oxidoreductase